MHGGLCEAGWEVSDIVSRGGQLLFGGERGRKRNPRNLVLILAGHHLMGQLMVVPMNLRHRGSRDYHEMIMLLQFAAFWAGFFQLYGYTLDLDVPAQFRRMQMSVSVTLGAVLWSRGFRYVVVGRRLLAALDGEPRMRACGALVLSIMGIFNAFVIFDSSRGDDLSSSVDAAAAAAPAERRPAGAGDAAAAPPAEALARDRERAPLEGDSRVTTLEKSTDVGAPQIKVEKQIGIEDMLCGAAAIRGALRANSTDLLTVILPQSLKQQPEDSQDLIKEVVQVVEMPENDDALTLDVASKRCNRKLITTVDQLVAFAFHDSNNVVRAADEAKEMDKIVTVMYLD
ncbi:hypothetical protein JL720_7597 [Aureococcus anophagefferens]|nr:hypothetical protein JL720_7597 [Aureococcus anophagefferens]